MSERLAPHASRLCGLLCRELGWRPPEFWAATPQEITAIFAKDTGDGQAGMDRQMLAAMMERDAHG